MDVIERFLTTAVREIVERILGRKTVPYEYYTNLGVLSADDIFCVLEVLLNEGHLSDAEDLLFSQYEKNPSEEMFEAGMDYFEKLERLTDENLAQCDFSREEVAKSKADFLKLAGK